MRPYTTLLILGLASPAFSQAGLYGKKLSGPVTLSNGMQVATGDTIKYGRGTRPSGDFAYINFPANMIVGLPESPFLRTYGGMQGIVTQLREADYRKAGKKTFAVVQQGRNALIDLESAIGAGEVIAINGKSVVSSAGGSSTGSGSVADELLKLKGLLDAGAITQTEYDQQKKKLLGQ